MFRIVGALALSAVVTVTGCAHLGPTGESGYLNQDRTIRVIPAKDRGEPIHLVGRDLQGLPLEVPSTSTSATVVNVWWSGCVECRQEAPILGDASRAGRSPATFVGINIRESGRDQAVRFEEQFGLHYRSFYDPGGRLLLQLHHAVPYSAIPTTVILDQRARVAAVILGVIPSARTLSDVIEEVAG
jgi:thiol-disulfide isomerase/thioredoxin